MGLRFRKSFKLAPGIRMTFGSGGTSFNFGPRGASISVGKRGVYSNVSAFGLSERTKLSGPAAHTTSARRTSLRPEPQTFTMDVTVGVTDQGDLYFRNSAGEQLPESWIKVARKQHADAIRTLIQTKCDEINAQIDAIGTLHHDTPPPTARPSYVAREFHITKPPAPEPHKIDLLARIFPRRRRRIEAANDELRSLHEVDMEQWRRALAAHRHSEVSRRRLIEKDIYSNVDAMERFLEESLQDVAWPRETLISAEIREAGKLVCLDVDLPEIEDMPTSTAVVPARGLKLSVKEIPPTHRQRLYMTHVHAIGFRIIGEVFAALPTAKQIVVSAYSQRRDKVTGREQDEYLYSARVTRDEWNAIDFSAEGLAALDIVEALTRFELRRTMSKTGIFKPIAPLPVGS